MSNTAARLAATAALKRAHTDARWGEKDLTHHRKQTGRLVSRLAAYADTPEVADFLRRVQEDPVHVDSRALHYGEPLWILRDLIP